MRTLEVLVEPSVLVWARKSAGYDVEEVAKTLQTTKDKITRWESGKERPTLSRLEKLAAKYKRPLAVFFLPKPPEEKALPKDFRILPGKKQTPLSPKTKLAIRRALRLQTLAKDLMESLGREPVSHISIVNRDNPENEAIRIRKMLDVYIHQQFGWKNEYEALRVWQKKIEEFGIFIFQLSIPFDDEIRGFSLTEGEPPAIVLNAKDAPNGKIFSIFHEFAHLLINDGGMCDMEEVHLEFKNASTEQFCNHLAGAILVPKEALLNHRLVREARTILEWPDATLQELASNFKVSREVILRRLVLFERASTSYYKRKHEEWKVESKRKKQLEKEKVKEEKKEKEFRRNMPLECIRENSIPFISLVLEAHAQEKITYNDIADYLSIRIRHLPKIEQLLRRRSLL